MDAVRDGRFVGFDIPDHHRALAEKPSRWHLTASAGDVVLWQYDIGSFEGKLWWPISGRKRDQPHLVRPEMHREDFAYSPPREYRPPCWRSIRRFASLWMQWPSGEFGAVPSRTVGESDKGQRWGPSQRSEGRRRGNQDRGCRLGSVERTACFARIRSSRTPRQRASGTGIRARLVRHRDTDPHRSRKRCAPRR